MNYEILFLKYQEEFREENKSLKPRKIYKRILKDLKYMITASCNSQVEASFKIEEVENNLYLAKMDPQNNELPLGYNLLVITYKNKKATMFQYLELFEILKKLATTYYQTKDYSKDILTVLQSLLEVATDVFSYDLEEYDKQIEQIEDAFEKDQMPKLMSIVNIKELIHFISLIICNQEELDFKGFQRAMLKKDSNILLD